MDNDLAHDLARAKGLLAKGKACPYFHPDHNGECLHCDNWIAEHGELDEEDAWAVYKLLASFTEIIDTITPGICKLIIEAIEFGRTRPHDHE